MIREISIQNFKSVEKLTLPLGRVNVLIGENGAGKSNILEGFALLGAAAADKLDSEFLTSRGIRVTSDHLMYSAFPADLTDANTNSLAVMLSACDREDFSLTFSLRPDRSLGFDLSTRWVDLPEPPSPDDARSWYERLSTGDRALLKQLLLTSIDENPRFQNASDDVKAKLRDELEGIIGKSVYGDRIASANKEAEQRINFSQFLIYSPENTALRRFEEEGQIQPVGIRGEGLFKMLQTFGREDYADRLTELKESLELIGWFLDFRVPANLAPGESRLQIIDRFLGDNVPLDQRNANEGFLFLLFYFAVFLSKSTPAFFAIDNVDASLNPRLCEALMRRLVELAVKYGKQVILTTHNPAILDGLNLTDDNQRLFSIYRTHEGRTQARRIPPPKVHEGDAPVRLSHAFLRGLLGGVPKNF